MGWSFCFSHTEKEQAVADRIRDWETETHKGGVERHSLRGNTLWTIHFVIKKETGEKTRYIGCDLLAYSREDRCWGYKDMSESCGPNEVSCPLSFLKSVPCPESEFAAPWRERVKAYHAGLKARKGLLASFKVGDQIELYGKNYSVRSTDPKLKLEMHGIVYKVPPRMLKDIKVLAKLVML